MVLFWTSRHELYLASNAILLLLGAIPSQSHLLSHVAQSCMIGYQVWCLTLSLTHYSKVNVVV